VRWGLGYTSFDPLTLLVEKNNLGKRRKKIYFPAKTFLKIEEFFLGVVLIFIKMVPSFQNS
jgi:hypothetical protein